MNTELNLKSVIKTSEDIVARDVGGEFILIPITSGIGDMDDELYTLNETGRSIWSSLDGKKTLEAIVTELMDKFDAPREKLTEDCLGFTQELLRRKMIAVEV